MQQIGMRFIYCGTSNYPSSWSCRLDVTSRWVINETWGFMGNSRKFAQSLNDWDFLQSVWDGPTAFIGFSCLSSLTRDRWSPRTSWITAPCLIFDGRAQTVVSSKQIAFLLQVFLLRCAYGPALPTPLTWHDDHLCDLMCNRLLGISSRCWMLLLWCISFMHNIYFFSTNGMKVKDDGLCNNVKL